MQRREHAGGAAEGDRVGQREIEPGHEIRFAPGQLPPVDAFWSLTLYDTDFFFVPNAINRYEVSQRNTFATNADGSIDIYIQADSPGKDKESNWLPAPRGKFALVMRMYGPKATPPTIVDGSWTPPPAKRVAAAP